MPCAKGMRECRRACGHRRIVTEYRAARESAEQIREAATGGYLTEVAEYGRLLGFGDWLRGLAVTS
jgi:hypothetical protein